MKALTLRQPWATLVAIGAKKIETRSWKTDYRGPLAIHAAKRFSKNERQHCYQAHILSTLIEAGYDSFSTRLPFGAVLAICTLTRIFRITETNAPEEPELSFGDYTPGRWAWYLEDIERLPEPIPAKGALGLWNWEIKDLEGPGLLRQAARLLELNMSSTNLVVRSIITRLRIKADLEEEESCELE